MLSRHAFLSLVASLALLSVAPAQAQEARREAPEINVEQLSKLLADPEAMKKTVVVDVRSDEETAVSVIPGAITKQQFEDKAKEHAGKKVVVYCMVGGRSTLYSRELLAKGFDAVNFKGSMLAWTNAGKPLVTLDGEPTNRVHTNGGKKAPAGYEAVRGN